MQNINPIRLTERTSTTCTPCTDPVFLLHSIRHFPSNTSPHDELRKTVYQPIYQPHGQDHPARHQCQSWARLFMHHGVYESDERNAEHNHVL